MSNIATLTSKGQTTIPKEIRDSLSLKTGDLLTFTLMPDSTVVMRVKNTSVTELAGKFHQKGRKAVPVELLSRLCWELTRMCSCVFCCATMRHCFKKPTN